MSVYLPCHKWFTYFFSFFFLKRNPSISSGVMEKINKQTKWFKSNFNLTRKKKSQWIQWKRFNAESSIHSSLAVHGVPIDESISKNSGKFRNPSTNHVPPPHSDEVFGNLSESLQTSLRKEATATPPHDWLRRRRLTIWWK